MEDFYLTLPSTTKSFTFKNTSSVYVTRLPQVLNLEKEKWVVAATDIIYPYSYKNVNKVLKFYIHFKDGRQPQFFDIPANQYNTAEQVLSVLGEKSRKRRNTQGDSIQEGVNKSIGDSIGKALDAKAAQNLLKTNENTVKNSALLSSLLTLVLLGSYDDVKDSENSDKNEGTSDSVTVNETVKEANEKIDIKDTAEKADGKIETNANVEIADGKIEGDDTVDKTDEVKPTTNVVNINENKKADTVIEAKEESLRDAIEKAMNSSFTKYLTEMQRIQEMESSARSRAIEQVLEKQSNFLNTLTRIDTPSILSDVTNRLTEEQTKILEKMSEKYGETHVSIKKAIEEAIEKQIVNDPKVDYKNLIKNIDESKLNELSTLRDAMQPRSVSFLSDLVQFTMENNLLRVTFKNSDIEFLEFDKECAYFLGFQNCIVKNRDVASNSIDFFGNISTFYVYCDIVDRSIVGNSKSSLLTVLPCKGNFGEMIQHTFPVPRYLPLMNSSIDSIKLSILNEFGEPIKFNWGSSIVTLHFRKIA